MSKSRAWILFVARRFMKSRRKSRSSVTALLSLIGLAVGVMTLITVISVMNGFQLNTIEDLVEINSFHLRISPGEFMPEPEDIEAIAGVQSAFPIIETQGLIKGMFSSSQAAVIKGLEAEMLLVDSDYRRRLGLMNEVDLGSGGIVLGSELARFLGVQRGDYISLLSLGGENISLSNPVETELQVLGLFSSGYYEFDRNWAFVSLETAAVQLNAGFRQEIAVRIDNRYEDLKLLMNIRQRFDELDPGQISSWRQFNRSIFGALRMEKAMMSFLIGLIFLVVGVNIFQGLRRSVHERMEDIAVIKVLGAGEREVRRVFLVEGLLIGLTGSLGGAILGLLVSHNINEIFALVEILGALLSGAGRVQIFSPSYFYLDEVPVRILPLEVLAISLVSFLSALISAWAASARVSSLSPKEVLNDE